MKNLLYGPSGDQFLEISDARRASSDVWEHRPRDGAEVCTAEQLRAWAEAEARNRIRRHRLRDVRQSILAYTAAVGGVVAAVAGVVAACAALTGG